MWIVLYLTVIFTYLAFVPENVPDMFWMPKEAMFTFLGFSVIGASWIQSNKRIEYRNLWAGILLIYTILGFICFFYGPLLYSKGKMVFNVWNYRPTINVVLGLFLMQVLVENTDSLKRWITLSKVICWTCCFCSVYALLQFCKIDQIFGASEIAFINGVGYANRQQLMFTFMSNKFLSSCFIAMTAPLCLMFNDYKYKIIYGLSFLALCLSDCTTPLAAFILSFLVYLVFMKKWKTLGVTIIGAIGVAWYSSTVFPSFFSGTGRYSLWPLVINNVIETNQGFIGNGIGSFGGNFKMGNLKALSAHNEFVQMFYEGGVILLGIFLCYMVHLLIRSIKYLRNNNSILFICYGCALISSLLISFNGFPFRIASLALLMILYLTSLEAQIQGEGYI